MCCYIDGIDICLGEEAKLKGVGIVTQNRLHGVVFVCMFVLFT